MFITRSYKVVIQHFHITAPPSCLSAPPHHSSCFLPFSPSSSLLLLPAFQPLLITPPASCLSAPPHHSSSFLPFSPSSSLLFLPVLAQLQRLHFRQIQGQRPSFCLGKNPDGRRH